MGAVAMKSAIHTWSGTPMTPCSARMAGGMAATHAKKSTTAYHNVMRSNQVITDRHSSLIMLTGVYSDTRNPTETGLGFRQNSGLARIA